ncbi:MAG TPA: hypothetical protein VE988_21965 [Gemmataceae bacterium]|nr:hypothetical protein [Gemmataceae bacterium]
MTRNTFRNYMVLSSLLSLALLHALWPTDAAQPVTLDAKVLDAFVARNPGPANMTGRIVQIVGVESNPKIVYVASASGGLFKTTDGGDTWKAQFQNESSVCIGDVAVSKSNPNVVWIGTGEHNVRNSGAWGDGVYKSTDGGETWTHMGLKDSHTIGRIAIHPTNPDIVYIGAMGHTWGPNKERGVFKTMDGGKTWEVSKFIDEDTGVVDLKMDPSDPNVLYAAFWKHRRDAFSGSDNPSIFFTGKQGGIYKTGDAGKSWEQLQVALPTSAYGRCGIDIYRKNPNVVYVVVQTDKTPVGEVNQGGANGAGGNPGAGGVYRSDDKGKTWKHLNTICPRPFYYGQIRVDPNDDNRVYVLGVNTAMSNDGGKNFGGKGKAVIEGDDPGATGGLVSLIGDDELQQTDPKKADQKKDDPKKDEPKKDDQPQKKGGKGGGGGGGKGGGMHSDHHALYVNPSDSNEVWLGTDGGWGVSRNKAQSFTVIRAAALAQFYGISVDMRKPYYIYGGLQDNGTWGGPSATYDETGIRQGLWSTIGIGGDGFHTANDPTDWTIVYGESQYGNFGKGTAVGGKGGKKGKGGDPDDPNGGGPFSRDAQRSAYFATSFFQVQPDKKADQKKDDPKKDDQKKDDPKKDEPQKKGGGKGGGGKGGGVKALGERFNWSSPLVLSPHDPKIVYYGGAYLLASERGANWKKISPDLTWGPDKGGKGGKGRNWAHTLFTINESPKKKGVIWTGADDGRIMVTQNNGETWTDASLPGVLKDGCVSRVEPSYHEDGTCYVSLTRYRNDDRKPYVFKTTDYGKNWTNISSNLPVDGSVHVVIESSRNRNLLFCGTEFGLFASLNGGQSWHQMKGGMSTVAVHDLVIHPRDRDLVVGTHGRSIYIFDDISPLEQLTPEVQQKVGHLFDARPAVAFKTTKSAAPKSNEFVGQNPAYGSIIRYNLRNAAKDASVSIYDSKGKELAVLKGPGNAGMNQVVWNLRAAGADGTVEAGEYLAVLRAGDFKEGKNIRVEAEVAQK